ncbi:MAG: hypothetical protein QXD32_03025 [Nitrososphaerota archaeon]
MAKEEGLDIIHKAAGLAFMRYACGSGASYRRVYQLMTSVSRYFESYIRSLLDGPGLASYDELRKARLMKRKYVAYSAYMATLSSYPLLASRAGLREMASTIMAKMSLITGIKVLDNINDSLHSWEEAVKSLDRQYEAISTGVFQPVGGDDIKARAENSSLLISALVHRWLEREAANASKAREIFLEDLRRYIEGQKLSFSQQSVEHREKIDIYTYLRNVNEKSIGRIWVDLDLCMLEQTVAELDERVIYELREAFDYLFKSCNIYDDVADLDVDMAAGIWNSVVYLGMEKGVSRGFEGVDRGLLRDTVRLGDLHYLKAVNAARRLGERLSFDVEGLLRCFTALRYFVMRKWFFRTKNPLDIIDFVNVRVTPEIMAYAGRL